jgi:phosphonopyruvate decarboxylase
MITPSSLLTEIEASGITFFTGVPDSLLKDFCACVSMNCRGNKHQIATNEGSAVAMAVGHYLATGRPAVVYMQNSGLGNAVNPLASLASTKVYGIPMILVIGWRGETIEGGGQIIDEPQHVHQGQITLNQLQLLEIPSVTVTSQTSDKEAATLFRQLVQESLRLSGPVAFVVRKGSFRKFTASAHDETHAMSREAAIKIIIDSIPANSPVVATTGMASRELYELRSSRPRSRQNDFLTVGGMGHAAQIAVGVARARADLLVVCIDGDGSVLMHTGALAVSSGCPNLLHFVINNKAHDSVGGQPTPQERLDFCALASALGYEHSERAHDALTLRAAIKSLINETGSRLLEVMCGKGSREDLGRPKETPVENKRLFMNFLNNDQSDA